jgi:hypothetical protein
MSDGRSDEAQDNQWYQEEDDLTADVFQTYDGTQGGTFYIKTGYDTYNDSYEQLYDCIVKEFLHFFRFKLDGANIMIIFEAKIKTIELWESLQMY